MIVISAAFTIQAGQQETVLNAMKAMAAETLKENGCHDYTFYSHLDDDQKVFLFEEWQDQACHGERPGISLFGFEAQR